MTSFKQFHGLWLKGGHPLGLFLGLGLLLLDEEVLLKSLDFIGFRGNVYVHEVMEALALELGPWRLFVLFSAWLFDGVFWDASAVGGGAHYFEKLEISYE